MEKGNDQEMSINRKVQDNISSEKDELKELDQFIEARKMQNEALRKILESKPGDIKKIKPVR